MASWSDIAPYYTSGWTPDQAMQDFNSAHGGDINRLAQSRGGSAPGGGGGAGQGVNVPQFSFDYQAAERDILLNPNSDLYKYYKQKLDEAQGDVTLAKKRIEDDYSQGVRYREEDLSTQLAEDRRTKEEEIRSTTTDLNKRGILFGQIPMGQETSGAPNSDLAQRFFLNPMTEKQSARKQAIERAITRQGEVADTTRKRGIEDINIAFPRYQRELEQEKLNKFRNEIVPYEYAKKKSTYDASTNPYMQGGG